MEGNDSWILPAALESEFKIKKSISVVNNITSNDSRRNINFFKIEILIF